MIYTCLNSRGGHIETVASRKADTFILVFRLFKAWRGHFKLIISDNDATFMRAENELLKTLKKIDQKKINFVF